MIPRHVLSVTTKFSAVSETLEISKKDVASY